MSDRQAELLENYEKMGASCFVLVSFKFEQFYRIPWSVWRDMKDIYGHKHLKRSEIQDYEIGLNHLGTLEFLKKTTYRLIGGDQMRKPRKEFSKTILRAVAAATVVIVVFSFALMWRTGDTSPLAYIIPGMFTELSAATGFYFWKAKAENEIKLDTIRRQKELEQSKKQNTEPGEYDPGSNYEGGTP